jgi:hypothetical protein
MTEQRGFDASKYLSKLQGKDYLEVKWRLLWLRTEHPEARIETEMMAHELAEGFALFKANVSIPDGGSATGWGSETARDFRDFIEKAETKALGRALAALGYGTQFCEDFDFAEGENRQVVDAPIDSTRYRSTAARVPAHKPATNAQNGNDSATAAQVRAIYSIARDQYALSETQVAERCLEAYGCQPSALSKRQASEYISSLKANGQPQ